MSIIFVYTWPNGAFVSTLDPEFEEHFDELTIQYGLYDHMNIREKDNENKND